MLKVEITSQPNGCWMIRFLDNTGALLNFRTQEQARAYAREKGWL